MVDLQGWAGRILYETKNGDKERIVLASVK
jgi:hypothetical protein